MKFLVSGSGFRGLVSALLLAGGLCASSAERHYDFRKRLEVVHEKDLRNAAAKCTEDEFELTDGFVIAVPRNAPDSVFRAAQDFQDYLAVSMGVSVRIVRGEEGQGNRCELALDDDLAERVSQTEVADTGVKVAAADERALAQALYHLEDLMNLRRAPFLKKGTGTRTALFSPRMTHSGWGVDDFPDVHLKQIAHAGMDAIIVFVSDVDKTKGNKNYQDVNGLIRRAKVIGLDTYLYSYIQAFVHPEDPGAPEIFENTYGRVSRAYPEAKGIIFVGESCEFPSKDERVIPIRAAEMTNREKGDTRPMAGYFPCRDYPDWVKAVSVAIRRTNSSSDIVFWTYNWGSQEEKARHELIDKLPKNISLMATWEMFEQYTHPNGYKTTVRDYTLAFAGPGKYFTSEASRAKRNGLRLYTMASTGGLTWDWGCVPYLPCPDQWKARWDGMLKANRDWGLAGVMESHHYGWKPNFVSELCKEAFTQGGMPYDAHIRAIAARDFGEKNAERIVAAWEGWSAAIKNIDPSHLNQYGMFRIGPAYPFNALGSKIEKEEFPYSKYAANGIGIVRLNYADDQLKQWVLGLDYFPRYEFDHDQTAKELELLRKAEKLFADGAETVEKAAEHLDAARKEKALRMAGLGEFMARTCTTAIHVKKAALLEDTVLDAKASEADKAVAKNAIFALAKAEYVNAEAALPLVRNDSDLGWEPTMEYVGGEEQILWKLARMRKIYGKGVAE